MDVKELVLRTLDDWNKKDKEAFLDHFTESSQITAPGGVILCGLDGLGMFWDVWQSAVPDNQGTINSIFAAGDQACHEGTFEGTHTGTLPVGTSSQIPPTGRSVRLRFTQVHTVCDDKFVTSNLYFDQVELFTQLGLMPMPGA